MKQNLLNIVFFIAGMNPTNNEKKKIDFFRKSKKFKVQFRNAKLARLHGKNQTEELSNIDGMCGDIPEFYKKNFTVVFEDDVLLKPESVPKKIEEKEKPNKVNNPPPPAGSKHLNRKKKIIGSGDKLPDDNEQSKAKEKAEGFSKIPDSLPNKNNNPDWQPNSK